MLTNMFQMGWFNHQPVMHRAALRSLIFQPDDVAASIIKFPYRYRAQRRPVGTTMGPKNSPGTSHDWHLIIIGNHNIKMYLASYFGVDYIQWNLKPNRQNSSNNNCFFASFCVVFLFTSKFRGHLICFQGSLWVGWNSVMDWSCKCHSNPLIKYTLLAWLNKGCY